MLSYIYTQLKFRTVRQPRHGAVEKVPSSHKLNHYVPYNL